MISKGDSIAEHIYMLSILQQKYVVDKLKQLQLNSVQARSLTYIFLYPGTIQRDIATYLGKQQATITNILKGLEERKIIYREIPKNNERQKNIFLTSDGEQLVKQVNLIFEQLNQKICNDLTIEEKKQLKKILIKAEKSFSEN
ncbi:MarR family winged helix-turn-helix transcriptional regulator [Isobaculum melis]|uniref:DNA-binding transcriptional regulator, MarR family n=1 Tax=Isobaculum melis TaxID=142588 RepID=A0A1H9T2B4_9LACT|nr:MarR family transcriptional regulator [Isobaculum melis]SER91400.1 DNA-binding transcriptional regulator, MarR family [Isobaculum melis]